jgi:hypothetical protein
MEYCDEQSEKDKDAYFRLCTEIVVRAYNDILPSVWYQFHILRYLKCNNKLSRRLLEKHAAAIEWFLKHRDEPCFEILGLSNLTDTDIIKAISEKFNNPTKFYKFYHSFANECGDKNDSQSKGSRDSKYSEDAEPEQGIC